MVKGGIIGMFIAFQRKERSDSGRGSGRCRIGCTSICHRGVSSRGGRCHGDVSDSGL